VERLLLYQDKLGTAQHQRLRIPFQEMTCDEVAWAEHVGKELNFLKRRRRGHVKSYVRF